ncbi:MAG: SBBP repeat-containing protein, partial [Candidatus Solibacter sp.]
MGLFGWQHLAATLCFVAGLAAADFTTYIGDAGDYRVARVIADASGNTYVAGSRDGGMFVMKLDVTGAITLFATLSGKGTDQPNDLAVDAAGNIYLAGATNSALLPLRNAMQSTPGPGFVVKFSPDGTQILYSTYFPEAIQALALDGAGNIYVTGTTYSAAFPATAGLPAGTVTPPGTIEATSAAFVTKIAAAGDRILYSARISGYQKNCGAGSSCFLSSRSTVGSAIAVDAAGNAYLAGNTDTYDLPTTSGALLGQGTGAFVAKVNAAGTALVYLTYLGPGYNPVSPNTNPANTVTAIAADAAGNAYVAG